MMSSTLPRSSPCGLRTASPVSVEADSVRRVVVTVAMENPPLENGPSLRRPSGKDGKSALHRACQTATRGPGEETARSDLRSKERERVLEQLLPPRPAPPLLERDDARVLEVAFEGPGQRGREARVEDVEVGLVVQPEGAVVEIRRARGHPDPVHDHDLA